MSDEQLPSSDGNGERPVEGTESRPGPDHRELSRIAAELLPTLIARFGESRLGELEIRQDGWRVRLRSGDGITPLTATPTVVGRNAAARVPSSGGEATGAREATGGTEGGRLMVTSVAVGYFQPVTGLAVGLRVRSGDLLGHVDVLGVRHDVVAGTDAMVTRVMAEPGQAVEYGQELVRLDRSSSDRAGSRADVIPSRVG